MEVELAHSQRKVRHDWAAPEIEPQRPVPKQLRTPVQIAPPQQSNLGERAERGAFAFATALFGGVLVAAVAGSIPPWVGIAGVVGLAATGLAYVAAWTLDNVQQF